MITETALRNATLRELEEAKPVVAKITDGLPIPKQFRALSHAGDTTLALPWNIGEDQWSELLRMFLLENFASGFVYVSQIKNVLLALGITVEHDCAVACGFTRDPIEFATPKWLLPGESLMDGLRSLLPSSDAELTPAVAAEVERIFGPYGIYPEISFAEELARA